jgi:hypothetical protein
MENATMRDYRFGGVALIAATVLTASPAFAGETAQRSFEIRGVVPLVCNATYDGNIAVESDGTIDLGAVREFCNSGSGYRVVATYSGSADPGSLIVDGRAVALNASGQTTIAESAGPAILSRQLAYRPGSAPIGSLRIDLIASAI